MEIDGHAQMVLEMLPRPDSKAASPVVEFAKAASLPMIVFYVPCGIAHSPREIVFPPREWVQRGYSAQRWTDLPLGGHFAALEQPEILAAVIRAFFGSFRRSGGQTRFEETTPCGWTHLTFAVQAGCRVR